MKTKLDIAAARKRCETATKRPWTLGRHRHWPRSGDAHWCWNIIAGIKGICHVEAERENSTEDAEFIVYARSDLPAALEALEEAQGKLEAVKEQVAYGFTGETLANMKDGMSGKEMNKWWRKTLDHILSKEG